MGPYRRFLAGIRPAILRHAIHGAVVGGIVGAVVGLVVGLVSYPPTAWFAVIELGLPGAFVGGWGRRRELN